MVITNNNCFGFIWNFNCFKPRFSKHHLFIQFLKIITSILGISAFYHDSAAAIIIDGNIIAAAQEERFSRKNMILDIHFNAIKYVLKKNLNEVDHIVFFEKPFLKFERLLETYMAFAPKLNHFSLSMPIWLSEKLFQKKFLFDKLKK